MVRAGSGLSPAPGSPLPRRRARRQATRIGHIAQRLGDLDSAFRVRRPRRDVPRPAPFVPGTPRHFGLVVRFSAVDVDLLREAAVWLGICSPLALAPERETLAR